MNTYLTVQIPVNHDTEAVGVRLRIVRGTLLASSLFNLIRASNDAVKGDALDVEHICELGTAIMQAVLNETQNITEVSNETTGL
jgi:hypothetical protein